MNRLELIEILCKPSPLIVEFADLQNSWQTLKIGIERENDIKLFVVKKDGSEHTFLPITLSEIVGMRGNAIAVAIKYEKDNQTYSCHLMVAYNEAQTDFSFTYILRHVQTAKSSFEHPDTSGGGRGIN